MLLHTFCEGGWLCFPKKSLLRCKLCCSCSMSNGREKQREVTQGFSNFCNGTSIQPMQCNGTSLTNQCNSTKPGNDLSCLQLCLFLSIHLPAVPHSTTNPIWNWISSVQRLNDNPWRWDIFTAGEAPSLGASGKLKLIPTSRLCST